MIGCVIIQVKDKFDRIYNNSSRRPIWQDGGKQSPTLFYKTLNKKRTKASDFQDSKEGCQMVWKVDYTIIDKSFLMYWVWLEVFKVWAYEENGELARVIGEEFYKSLDLGIEKELQICL